MKILPLCHRYQSSSRVDASKLSSLYSFATCSPANKVFRDEDDCSGNFAGVALHAGASPNFGEADGSGVWAEVLQDFQLSGLRQSL